jgi:hypothetical protein
LQRCEMIVPKVFPQGLQPVVVARSCLEKKNIKSLKEKIK